MPRDRDPIEIRKNAIFSGLKKQQGGLYDRHGVGQELLNRC
jgi:hypothetical protein